MRVLEFFSFLDELLLDNKAVKSPIFSPDGNWILWIQRKSGGAHACCNALVKTNAPLVPQV